MAGYSHLDRPFLLGKLNSLVDFHLWPPEARVDPRRWLGNFRNDADAVYAHHLLNGFTYLSGAMTAEVFSAGFHSLSSRCAQSAADFPTAARLWRSFCDSLIITHVTGEQPNPSDSGAIFVRMMRTVVGLREEQLFPPDGALAEATATPSRPVLFVDDFVGSGNQFVDTWKRSYSIGATTTSFKALAHASPSTEFFYCPAICTAFGARNIRTKCPAVHLSPGHLLPPEYSALHPASVIWPDDMRAEGAAFIERTSRAAGIPDLGGQVDDYRGFNRLGLTLAFSHSVPDATLPLFYWEGNGWHPLVRRR
ncbi:hypothetical protein [Roseomonas sp. CECT 9278]|uniref:phosphoribosyltransferase-like protein n=1 Tax=Roseomonas sp. CECT 9278 TaxID=2845823 RepID=UPI001E4A1FD9|nr:hypothetical protein [Roseomonas sp. CECT 9278]CAH0150191.1 hypothetical protein ROS9278_00699 [Roseomonas sp. CECT 9278]